MAQYTSVLHQLLRYVPRDEFRAIVERHQGDKGVRKLSSWGQVVALFFGHPGDLRGAVLLPVPALSASGSRSAFRLPASGVQAGCDGDRSVPESL